MMNFDNFIATLKQKFFIVIALVIVASLGLAVEKYFTATPNTHLAADASIQCLTRLDTNHAQILLEQNKFVVASHLEFYRFIDLHRDALEQDDLFITSQMEFYRFIEQHQDDFDYQKFNGNWNELSVLAKCAWLDKHIEVKGYEHSIYIFELTIGASEPHDYDYVKANAARLLDAYVEFARQECIKAGVGDLNVVDHIEIIPNSITLTRSQLVLKHAIIGAVLGLIVGLIIIFGLSKRAATHG